jgi:proline dehydrogenase
MYSDATRKTNHLAATQMQMYAEDLPFIFFSESVPLIEPNSGRTDALDLTFLDHNAAFKSKKTWEVLRAYLVFQLCSITPLVANNEKVRKIL